MKGMLLTGVVGLALLLLVCPSCRAPAIEAEVEAAAVAPNATFLRRNIP